jgi:hypothetical protein
VTALVGVAFGALAALVVVMVADEAEGADWVDVAVEMAAILFARRTR